MATRTRRTAARSSGRKKFRGLLWLLSGLFLGAAVMYGVQTYLYQDGKPLRGLASLFKKKPAEKDQENHVRSTESERTTKPKLDFYTILPGETVLPEPRREDRKATKPEPAEKGTSYILQAAAFTSIEDADRLKAKLVLNGLEPHIERIIVGDKGTYYRVRLGPYSRLDDLDASSAKLSKLGIKAIRLKVKRNTNG
jgi:cell division protein FtsN